MQVNSQQQPCVFHLFLVTFSLVSRQRYATDAGYFRSKQNQAKLFEKTGGKIFDRSF